MKKYSLSDLSLMSGLTTRTLRNYLALGILNGTKEGNKWFFSEENCYDFFSNNMVKHSIEAKGFGLITDSFNYQKKDKICSIINIKVAEFFKFNKLMQEELKEYTNFNYKMDKYLDNIRIIFSADINQTIKFIGFIRDNFY